MTRLTWGERPPMFDLGVDHGVLYLGAETVPWNGLVSVNEKPAGALNLEHYFDGNRIHITQDPGSFEATITAYTYPEVFEEYTGYSDVTEYRRFGFSYRTHHGLDATQIHIVYEALIKPDSRSWRTQDASANAELFTWALSGEPKPIPGASPSSHLILDVPEDSPMFQEISDILYGTETTPPRLPEPAEIVEFYEAATLMRVTNHGDGSYTITGPDDMVWDFGDGSFRIDAPTLFLEDDGRFTVHSF